MKTRNVHQTVVITAPVGTVYKALMNPRQHSKIAGSKASIRPTPGSRFSVWGGSINGFTLGTVSNKMIVQAWRAEDWPKGHYSTAIFRFQKSGGGTKLVFDQYAVPAKKYADMSKGWKTYYWDPMKKLLEHKGQSH
jgi:activator of HSP90 ATPase